MWQINHRKASIQKDRNFRVKTVHEKNNKPICLRCGFLHREPSLSSLYLVYNIYCILANILDSLAGATSGAVLLLSEHINSSCSWWGMGTVLLVCSFLISLCLAVCLFIGHVFVLLFLFTIFSHHILFSSVFITRCKIIDLPWMSMKATSTFHWFADNILCNIADTSWLFLSFNIIERTCKEVLHISWWSHRL
jgi:hypothetical protein